MSRATDKTEEGSKKDLSDGMPTINSLAAACLCTQSHTQSHHFNFASTRPDKYTPTRTFKNHTSLIVFFFFMLLNIRKTTVYIWPWQGGPELPRTVLHVTSHPGISRDIPGCPSPGGSVKSQSPRSKMSWDTQGHGTSCDVPDLEAVLSPRVPGSRCPGMPGDILGCSRFGGSVRSQSPRSKISWDTRGHPGMSQTWRQC